MAMSEKDYLFYLRYFDGTDWYYYEELTDGTIFDNISPTPTKPIQFAPVGWDEVKREWLRGWTYYGIFSQFTSQYKFVKDGAKILRHVYFNQGVEGKVQLYVEKLNRTATSYGYEPFFQGDIDFNRHNNQKNYFAVEITQAGFIEKLTARESTDYEFEVRNSADRVWVKLHGIHLQYNAKWSGITNENVNTEPTYGFITDEGTNQYLLISEQVDNGPGFPYGRFVENASGITCSIDLDISYNYNVFIPSGTTTGGPYKFRIFYEIINATTGATVSTSDIYLNPSTQASGTSQTYVGTNSQTITLLTNRAIYIFVELQTTTGPAGTVSDGSYDCTQLGSQLELFYDNKIPTKYIACKKQIDLLQELVDKISDGDTTASSTLLGATHNDIVITCGDAARNLPNAIMKTNFSDFFKFTNCVLGTSLAYDSSTDNLELEEKAEVFQNALIEDLGEVTALEISAWTDEMFNNLEHGYQAQVYDEVNGKDEFNTLVKRLSTNLRVQQTKNYVSPYRADAYGISLVSLNLGSKEYTDSSTDNDIWALHIETSVAGTIPDGYDGAGEDYYNLYMDTIPPFDIQNIYSPETMFNIDLSPMRCFDRSKAWFASLLHLLDTTYLKFQVTDKTNKANTHMITDDGTTVIDEGADILVSDLGDPMLYPILFKATIKNPKNIHTLLQSNPYGYFTFTWLNESYSGFLIRAVDNVGEYKQQDIYMISTPLNLLSKLIY